MKRRHTMPFGAERLDDGSVRFRLWGPKARNIAVCLGGELRNRLPMTQGRDGWFELRTDLVEVGDRYKFEIDGRIEVPDPASRFQPDDVHGSSVVVDPTDFDWTDDEWRGRPWEEAVIYELHVGTFSSEGTFAGVQQKLQYLADLGVTAIELMPVADFPGTRNWGYDGVLPFAPDSAYGGPCDLKRLIQSAHKLGLMVFLDVVYNHFGPEGNYLREYSPQFFTDRHHTPWGDAINFDGPDSKTVRDFFIQNALYWLLEYNFDGLRLDAVHLILDDSPCHFLVELAERVRMQIPADRMVHLVLENDNNQSRYLKRGPNQRAPHYNAQWNDDVHHSLHVSLTGERDGYYSDYADRPAEQLGRCLTEGFAYQGEASPSRDGEKRGECSRGLPPSAFVSFLQNHDQIGNRAFGERIGQLAETKAVRAAMATLLLAPQPPLLFMGEEFGAETPFLFFCDFGPELAQAVSEGRRNEFARFKKFSDPAVRENIPDPNDRQTYLRSKLDWNLLTAESCEQWLAYYRKLLAIRKRSIVPLMRNIFIGNATYDVLDGRGLLARWPLKSGSELCMMANLSAEDIPSAPHISGTILFTNADSEPSASQLAPWTVRWVLRS